MAKIQDFNKKLIDSKDLPKIIVLKEQEAIKRYGGSKMLIAPPLLYNDIMKAVPFGKVITSSEIRSSLAKSHDADCTCPLTAGIFIGIAAKASEQREDDKIPFWRTLKPSGELNEKYPGGIEAQKEKLSEEGHTFTQKGKTKIRYFVENYEEKLHSI